MVTGISHFVGNVGVNQPPDKPKLNPVVISAPEHYGLRINSDTTRNSISMSPWIKSIKGIKIDLDNSSTPDGKRIQLRVTTQGLEITDISNNYSSVLLFQDNAGEKRFAVDANSNVMVGRYAYPTKDSKNILILSNTTSPKSSSPFEGGQIYVENGALKYRGAKGTITTLATP